MTIASILRARPGQATAPIALLLLCVLGSGGLYGAIMGCYNGAPLQSLYSAIKVPFLLLVTFGLSLPSFFVLNTLLGVRADFGAVLRAIVNTQAALTLTLAAFAPITLFVYASGIGYSAAILLNALFFGIASATAQATVQRRLYGPLIARSASHRLLLRVWIVLYGFVGIQMGWILRPFIGSPFEPTRFFRPDAWGNAYVVVWRLVWGNLF